MSLYQDPESRSKRKPEPSAPLFEQSFYKFEQQAISVAKECFERAHARRNDPATSKAAASVRIKNLGRTRDGIMDVLKVNGPQTDEQIAETYMRWYSLGRTVPRSSPSGLRSRRSELVSMGFIEDSGNTAATASGRQSTIWRLK